MLGLVISDSFQDGCNNLYSHPVFGYPPDHLERGNCKSTKSLIPKYPHPSSIPFYGELIVARWAYEALAVEQFCNNPYEKPLFVFDEAMSIYIGLQENYWLTIASE